MNSKLKLSIGMIVKNEEENLERCLEAIQPLMQGVKSELIIADTGSSDRTVEIAHRYTEKVCFFKWCDDFASARNYVLDQAKGEWFLQIDADEWLEKTDLITKFLNSPESQEYTDVYYIMKNFLSYNRNDCSEVYVKRLFRVLQGRKYEGIVHEHVDDLGRVKFIDEYVDHYGYVPDPHLSKKNKKNRRNLPLLIKELEKEPDNLLMLYQLAQEYMCLDDVAMLEETCAKIIKKFGSKKDDYYVTKSYWMMNRVYLAKNDYLNVLKVVDEYLNYKKAYSLKMLDVLCQGIDAGLRIEEYEKTNQYCKKLFTVLEECDNRKACGEEGFSASVDILTPKEKERRRYQYAYSLKKCGNYGESFLYLKKITGELGEGLLSDNIDLWYSLLTETNNYSELSDYYFTIKNNDGNIDYVKKIILAIGRGDPAAREAIAFLFSEAEDEDEFIRLQKLFYKEIKGKNIIGDIEPILEEISPLPEYDRLIYLSIKYKVPIEKFLVKCSSKMIAALAYQIIEEYQEVKEELLYESELKCGLQDETRSLKEELFHIKMQERLLFDVHLLQEQVGKLFNSYIYHKMRYVKFLIRPELLEDPACDNLPEEYGFSVYCSLALEAVTNKEYKKSLSYYKKAFEAWPFMKDIVKIKINEIKAELDKRDQERREFELYAKKVKKLIWEMVNAGNYDAAKEALTAYKKVNPTDMEINILISRLAEHE